MSFDVHAERTRQLILSSCFGDYLGVCFSHPPPKKNKN